MSLFLFGVKRISASQEQAINDEESLPSHMPSVAESGLGRVELDAISSSGVGKLADPSPSACKKRKMRGKYVRYTPEERASIGKYALENGNERARRHFQSLFLNLTESTIRNFKKAYGDMKGNRSILNQLQLLQLSTEDAHQFFTTRWEANR